jgi:hypothetical protein
MKVVIVIGNSKKHKEFPHIFLPSVLDLFSNTIMSISSETSLSVGIVDKV